MTKTWKLAIGLVVYLFVTNTAFGLEQAEYVVKSSPQPWLTNPPYLDDPYSQEYARAKAGDQDNINKAAAKCLEKHLGTADEDFWRTKCQLNAIRKTPKSKMPSRGSFTYVKQHYLPMKKLAKGAFASQLKQTLEQLNALRASTRMVGGLASDQLEPGELSYEQVNQEICLIEQNVGHLSTKTYCHR